MLTVYPPSKYPKLYPKPVEHYWKAKSHFQSINLFILLLGFFMMVVLIKDPTNDDWAGVVTGYYLIQMIPMILNEVASFKYYKLMRMSDSRTIRRAGLDPRRLFDFISPAWVGLAVFLYVAFAAYILYLKQFNYPWFGGYANIAIISAANLFLAGIIAWNIYGKKMDPYQTDADRVRQTKLIVKQIVLVSIFMTAYAAISIFLQAMDLHHYKQLAVSLYLQIITLISLQNLSLKDINFDVYKEE